MNKSSNTKARQYIKDGTLGPVVIAQIDYSRNHHKAEGMWAYPIDKDAKPGVDRGAFFCEYNTNKLGISVDLTKPKGKELALKLVKWADLVTESMAPGAMAEMGLDYEGCRKVNPTVIVRPPGLAFNVVFTL